MEKIEKMRKKSEMKKIEMLEKKKGE